MKNGKYTTAGGSTVEISGKHSGIFTVRFDWFEEIDACYNCEVQAQPDEEGYLVWHCEICGGGKERLYEIPT